MKQYNDPLSIQKINNVPTFVHSIATGVLSGEIYTDDINQQQYNMLKDIDTDKKIQSLPLWVESEKRFCYVRGHLDTTSDAFCNFVKIRCQQRLEQAGRFIVFSDCNDWDQFLNTHFTNSIQKTTRKSLLYKRTQPPYIYKTLPPGYSLQKINEAVIHKSRLFDEKYYREYWNSISNYVTNGFGYAIIYKDEVVCECTSIFANKWSVEIDIQTDTNHRGLGLASIAAKAFIEHGLNQEQKVIWDCTLSNTVSYQLALQLGFEHVHTYNLWNRS
ncbi:GNAT family N-acetyltransferase [Paenibacillus sp. PsM32]|uniref:GNAT family N-acetyltransferase n=1 Tax=Paenibacillus sp. PsM32 TaxID=3030536 RepID=UPI00263B267A|nr:GNAT family N-acetyltransferase [Paenibacillus sp. PsM32]MDN4620519.1 GNAT family N-acetyltransferase [Paenibacillus sp. PsM32]